MMDRITGRNEKGELLVNGEIVYAGELYEVASALEEYEDMEEQGKMLMLPCKPGDILYETQFINRKWEIFPFKVNYFEVMKSHGKTRIEIYFEETEGYALCDEHGNLDEGWYLTEPEAEKALKDIERRNDG